MDNFGQALAHKDFLLTVELDPPRGADLKPLEELAARLGPQVDALVVSDNRGAVPRLAAAQAASRLASQGAPVILTLACRDVNRLGLTSQMLAAWAGGVASLLLVSGDYPSLGDHPGAKPVYDLDSVQALELAQSLNQGRDLSGYELDGATGFLLGATVAAQANPWPPQALKLQKKARAGARFVITRPLDDLAALAPCQAQAASLGLKLLAGLEVAGPGRFQEVLELARQVRGQGLAAGVHLAMPGGQEGLPGLVEAIVS